MDQPSLTLPIQAIPRRRGRPPGAKNKRSMDLGRYVEAQFAGLTPGQVSAQICLVTAGELKRAKADAKELQIVDLDLDRTTLALVVKATRLARALGINRAEAWVMMIKEREALLPYIHQKQPQAQPAKPGERAVAFLVPEGQESAVPLLELGDEDAIEILDGFSGAPAQVGQPKSDGDT